MTVSAQNDLHFSLVQGGPLHRLCLRAGLARPPLDLLNRRLLFFPILAWLPPFIMSLFAGTALGGVPVPFIQDVATQVRLLVCIPLFIFAEKIAHERMKPIVDQFIDHGIVPPEARSRLDAAIASVLRWGDAPAAEAVLAAFALTFGHRIWLDQSALHAGAWYGETAGSAMRWSPAGLWFIYCSLPLFQFMLLRWFYRWALWARFLFQVSRLPLHMVPTHPDRCCGLSFLSNSAAAFAPIVMAQSAAGSGSVAGRIFFEGAQLSAFKHEILVVVVFQVLFVLGPLCVFAPHLWMAKRLGRRAYGALASRYVEAFDRKWNPGDSKPEEGLLGTADIQSLADLANSFAVVEAVRPFPFSRDAAIRVAVAALLPFSPLLLTVFPLEQIVLKLLRLLF